MFFAGKEKKTGGGGSKVLTEAEIKKKLYGDFESASSDIHLSSHESKSSTATYDTASIQKRSAPASAPVRSTSFGSPTKPEILTSRASSLSSEIPPRRVPETKKSNSAQIESSDWKQGALQVGKVALGVLAGVLWKLGSYLVQALDFVLRILDPRKPQARRILYSITACILVFALFWGVFRLNAQRKKAMMGELPTVTVASSIPNRVQKPVTDEVLTKAALPPSSVKVQTEENQETILRTIENSENALPAASAPVVTPAVAVPTTGRFVIQVATYASPEDANRLIQNLDTAGFKAFYKKRIRNATGRSFFPVYLGRFESMNQAQQALNKFRKSSIARPFQDSFIHTMES